MTGYLLGPDAALDLEELWEYIAADDLIAADRWIDRLFEAFQQLAEMPGMGHRRDDLTPHSVLFWPVGQYLIIYRAQVGQAVEIVAVTQGSRDLPFFLRRRLP